MADKQKIILDKLPGFWYSVTIIKKGDNMKTATMKKTVNFKFGQSLSEGGSR